MVCNGFGTCDKDHGLVTSQGLQRFNLCNGCCHVEQRTLVARTVRVEPYVALTKQESAIISKLFCAVGIRHEEEHLRAARFECSGCGKGHERPMDTAYRQCLPRVNGAHLFGQRTKRLRTFNSLFNRFDHRALIGSGNSKSTPPQSGGARKTRNRRSKTCGDRQASRIIVNSPTSFLDKNTSPRPSRMYRTVRGEKHNQKSLQVQ